MKIEKVDGRKVTLLLEHIVNTDKDEVKSVEASLRVTLDLVELFNEVTKKELPEWLKEVLRKVGVSV